MKPDADKLRMEVLETTKRFVMDRKSIGFFKAILESYEDVAIFSVLDGKSGLIELVYPCYFEKDVVAIMSDMKNYGIVFEEAANAEHGKDT
jgi:hypothetical protein